MTFLATALTATLMSCLHFCLLFTQARYPNAWHVLTLQGLYCNNISHLSLLSHQRLLSGLDTGTHCSLSEQFFGFSGETEEPMTLSFYMTSKIASSTWSIRINKVTLNLSKREFSALPQPPPPSAQGVLSLEMVIYMSHTSRFSNHPIRGGSKTLYQRW